ncbi:MAG TPA: hypothetical protein VFY66_08690, partial [Anaerolineales bacterium]|nr:hypothetical protein [Anaerolineales bacterium]
FAGLQAKGEMAVIRKRMNRSRRIILVFRALEGFEGLEEKIIMSSRQVCLPNQLCPLGVFCGRTKKFS